MYPRGIGKGMRRVVLGTESSTTMCSPTTGVVLGEPDAARRVWNLNPNLVHAKRLDVSDGTFGPLSLCPTSRDLECGRAQETPAFSQLHSDGVRTVGTYDKPFHLREMSLRWTKNRRRPNPVRRSDCDLRFSFPRCSRTLPFLSHDARVELGRSVMPS